MLVQFGLLYLLTDQPKLGAIIVNYPRGQASIVMFMRKGLESLYLVSRPSPAVSTGCQLQIVPVTVYPGNSDTGGPAMELWMYNVNLEGQNRQKYTKLSFED